MKLMASLLVAVVLALAGSAGCGYALAGRGSFLPPDIKVVGIPQLANRTPFTGIETIVTQKIRDEFIGRSRKYEVKSESAGAHALLNGEIVSVTQVPAGTTDVQLASRYRFTVTMKLSFTDTRDNKVLWSNDSFVLSEEYQLTFQGPIEGGSFVNQQRSAVDRLAADVARTVVTAITEAF